MRSDLYGTVYGLQWLRPNKSGSIWNCLTEDTSVFQTTKSVLKIADWERLRSHNGAFNFVNHLVVPSILHGTWYSRDNVNGWISETRYIICLPFRERYLINYINKLWNRSYKYTVENYLFGGVFVRATREHLKWYEAWDGV